MKLMDFLHCQRLDGIPAFPVFQVWGKCRKKLSPGSKCQCFLIAEFGIAEYTENPGDDKAYITGPVSLADKKRIFLQLRGTKHIRYFFIRMAEFQYIAESFAA